MPLLNCKCGALNRIPSQLKQRVRCGSCAHTFTPTELVKARPEPPPERPQPVMTDLSTLFGEGDDNGVDDDEACSDCGRKLTEDDYCDYCDGEDEDDLDDEDEDED